MFIDLTDSPAPKSQQYHPCPICNLEFPSSTIQEHCESHFTAALDVTIVTCSLCSLHVPVDQLDSHEAAHAAQKDALNYQSIPNTTRDTSLSNELYFQQLRARYGFEPPIRPGSCYLCKQPGHWASDCPQNRSNQSMKQRIIPNPTHTQCLVAQAPDPQYTRYQQGGVSIGNPQYTRYQQGGVSIGIQIFSLLSSRLASQYEASTEYSHIEVYLSLPTLHFAAQHHDAQWSCGYRNIQMQIASFMLQQENILSDPCNDLDTIIETNMSSNGNVFAMVPDIASLQAWIECSWNSGFDPEGAEQLGHQLQGTKKWIGTTEAAALLRYLGYYAVIIDFGVGGSHQSTGAATKPLPATSLVEEVHHGVKCDKCGLMPIIGPRYKSEILSNYDLCGQCHHCPESLLSGPYARMMPLGMRDANSTRSVPNTDTAQRSAGHGVVQWIYESYFKKNATFPDDVNNVLDTNKTQSKEAPTRVPHTDATDESQGKVHVHRSIMPPLYFQHEGHSRTIIGIEKRVRYGGSSEEYSLLLFDPVISPAAVHDALLKGKGWQYLIKRGVHTLKEKQFQLLFVKHQNAGDKGYDRATMKKIVALERY